MTYFKASLRRGQGVNHSDGLYNIYCHGADEAAARAHAEQQHPAFSCKKLEARHVAIVAETKTLASQWICKIIACCQPGIASGETHFGSINLHALSSSESLIDAYFDEVHVVTTQALTSEQLDSFGSRTKLLCLHALPSQQWLHSLQHRVFNWTSANDFTVFLGHIFSVHEVGIFPISFAQATASNGPFHLIHSHEPSLVCALNSLLNQVGVPASGKHHEILLIMDGCHLTLGDYATAGSTLEEHFAEECVIAISVVCNAAAKEGYNLWMLLGSPQADAPIALNQGTSHGQTH